MMTNEIVGLPILKGADLPGTLDRLTEKVKTEKAEGRKKTVGKKKFEKTDTNAVARGSSNFNRSGPQTRKRKIETEGNDSSKKPRVNSAAFSADEKPNWKLMKKEQKELKEKHKMKKRGAEVYELTKEAKIIWEDLRQESCPKAKRAELSTKLFAMVSPHLKKLVFTHDISRVVECIVAVGAANLRDAIFKDLKDDILTLVKNKYASFLVLKMLKYGNKTQRSFIMNALQGEVVALLRKPISAAVVESAYNDYANASERALITQEFYGPEFRVFKDELATSLGAVLTKYPEKRDMILKNFKFNLLNVISKSPWKLTIVHTLLKEFLVDCDAESQSDLLESLKNELIHILHTRDGARVAMMCIWNGTPKDRKIIVKSFKTHVEKIVTNEHGYLVMLALFDSVDDTVLVSKAIIQEMMESIENVLATETGRKVILYLIQPRNTTYFHPNLVEILALGDVNEYSKKAQPVRQKELLDAVQGDLISCFERNLEQWIKNNKISLVLKALVESAVAAEVMAVKPLLEKLIRMATREVAIENVLIFKMFKTLITQENADGPAGLNFTDLLLSNLEETEDNLNPWIRTKRGCLTMVVILERKLPALTNRVKKLLNGKKNLISSLNTPMSNELSTHLV